MQFRSARASPGACRARARARERVCMRVCVYNKHTVFVHKARCLHPQSLRDLRHTLSRLLQCIYKAQWSYAPVPRTSNWLHTKLHSTPLHSMPKQALSNKLGFSRWGSILGASLFNVLLYADLNTCIMANKLDLFYSLGLKISVSPYDVVLLLLLLLSLS